MRRCLHQSIAQFQHIIDIAQGFKQYDSACVQFNFTDGQFQARRYLRLFNPCVYQVFAQRVYQNGWYFFTSLLISSMSISPARLLILSTGVIIFCYWRHTLSFKYGAACNAAFPGVIVFAGFLLLHHFIYGLEIYCADHFVSCHASAKTKPSK